MRAHAATEDLEGGEGDVVELHVGAGIVAQEVGDLGEPPLLRFKRVAKHGPSSAHQRWLAQFAGQGAKVRLQAALRFVELEATFGLHQGKAASHALPQRLVIVEFRREQHFGGAVALELV